MNKQILPRSVSSARAAHKTLPSDGNNKSRPQPKPKKVAPGVTLRFHSGRQVPKEVLLAAFKEFGEVLAFHMNYSGGKYTGCGTVSFNTLEEAYWAMRGLHTSIMGGHMFYLQPRPCDGEPDCTRVFVSWAGRTEEETISELLKPNSDRNKSVDPSRHTIDVVLHILFSLFGDVDYVVTVPSAEVPGRNDRAFVKFGSNDDVEAVLRFFEGGWEPISVCRAWPRRY